MIGRHLAHYEVMALLGRGGMGEVYRARDTRLGRDVALKILPPGVASDAHRLERFQREARALAALAHPNIVTVFSVEQVDDVHLLTMELVEGQSLEVRGEAAMALPRLIDIAGQLADALHAAHERGIVHRDLKPANVMVTDDGRVKVLDFGLAKQADDDPGEGTTVLHTNSGAVIGTVAYMSPEQAQGQQVDRRSDIFSMGVVLHELATGRRPFRGNNTTLVLSAILRDDPPPVSLVDARLPLEFSDIVSRCLKKDPGSRYQTARDVGDALRASVSGGRSAPVSAPSHKTVVVLPFVNRSPDQENEYFADGLTEEVIADLSKVSAIRVISRNSAMALKGTSKDTHTLARELGVSHLVTGSVRRAGHALRVTAELVDAGSDQPAWSDKYSGTVEDVFGIQEEISRKIVSALEVTLSDSEERQVAERPIEDVVAYDGYLRARQELVKWTPNALQNALRLVDDALAIVGDNALLFATKGQISWTYANVMMDPTGERLDEAGRLADRALAIDPNLHLGIFVRGLVAGLRGQVERALDDLWRAWQLAPSDANVLGELCRFSNAAGLQHQGDLVRQVAMIDPLTALTPLVVSTYSSVTGRFEEAAVAARRAVTMAPTHSGLHFIAGWQIAEAGHVGEAADLLGRTGEAVKGTVLSSAALFLKCALEGRVDEALSHAAPDLERTIRSDHFVRPIAGGYALLGRRAEALEWTRKAIECGFTNYPCLAEYDPFLAPLRSTPEFMALMDSLKPRWEAVVEWEARARAQAS